eukprot:5067016-Prymnesium_polylepis.1
MFRHCWEIGFAARDPDRRNASSCTSCGRSSIGLRLRREGAVAAVAELSQEAQCIPGATRRPTLAILEMHRRPIQCHG